MKIEDGYAIISTPERNVRWKLSDIIYFECYKNYISVNKENDIICFRSTMTELEEALKDSNFIKINKGIILNENQVRNFRKFEIVLKNGKSFSVSRRRYQLICEHLKQVNLLTLFLF